MHGDRVGTASVHFGFMVTATRGRFKVSKRGLHQTHLRGLPGSRCREHRLRRGSSWGRSSVPRRALEIQPYRVVGQHVIQNDGLTARDEGNGRVPCCVLVLARLDARAAVARFHPARLVKIRHGPGANQSDWGRALDAGRVAGSTACAVVPERCRSFGTPCSRSAHGAPVRRSAPRTGRGSSCLLDPAFFPAAPHLHRG